MSVNDPHRRRTEEYAQFHWSETSEEAARLVAQCRLGFPAIAKRLGIARETLYRWRKNPDFQAKINALYEEQIEAVRQFGHLDRQRRAKNMVDRYEQLNEIIEERATSDFEALYNPPYPSGMPNTVQFPKPPGYETGLLLVSREINNRGIPFLKVQLDKALLDALLEFDKRIAQYTGEEWAVRSGSKPAAEDDDPIIDEGTVHTMTPKDRLSRLMSLMKDDPEYAHILRDLTDTEATLS